MRRLLAFVILLLALPAAAATNVWFVDCNVVGGSHNGTSWANAWTNFTEVNVDGLGPGDMVWVSGGTYVCGGVDISNQGANGVYGSNIVFKASQEEGHNSKVIMYGGFGLSRSYYTFDGAKHDGMEAVFTNTVQMMDMVTNINWVIHGYSPGRTNSPFSVAGGNGPTVKWCEITATIPREMMPESVPNYSVWRAAGTAFQFGDGVNITNASVSYCWIHDVAWNGFTRYGGGRFFGLLDVHHNLIETMGQDYFEFSAGWDVHHNVMHGSTRIVGHQDGIVVGAGNMRAWNNFMYDLADTTPFFPTVAASNAGCIMFYGNVLYYSQWDSSDPVGTAINATAEDTESGPVRDDFTNNPTWHDWYFLNNTVHVTNMLQGGAFSVVNTKYPDTIFVLSNWNHFNNLYVNDGSVEQAIAGFGGDGADYPAGSGTTSQVAQVHVDYNVFAGSSVARRQFSYMGTAYSASTFNEAMTTKSNYSAMPTFVDIARHDYRLAAADNGARGLGTNLAALVSSMPGLDYDVYGNYRGAGHWDIGAIAYQASPPALPDVPSFVSASRGTYSNGVKVVWSAATGADYYSLWRWSGENGTNGIQSSMGTRLTPAHYTGTNYIESLAPGVTNTYWVMAERQNVGWSMLSAPTNGFALAGGGDTNEVDPTLVARWTFQDLGGADTNPVISDVTGNGHDAHFLGFAATPTNWPTRVTWTNGLLPYAASFVQNYGTNNQGHPYGQYAAVTNLAGINGMTQATFCVWLLYNDQPTCTLGSDHNAKAFDSGYGTNATFSLGRLNSDQTRFTVFTNATYQTDGPLSLLYPDLVGGSGCGTTTNWHFYAATVDLTTGDIKAYFDGTNCASRNIGSVATNLFAAPGEAGGSYVGQPGWIGIGCETHVGSAPLDADEFPNNGWMNGFMADLRIYNRALSDADILSIYAGGVPGGGGGQPQPPTYLRARVRR